MNQNRSAPASRTGFWLSLCYALAACGDSDQSVTGSGITQAGRSGLVRDAGPVSTADPAAASGGRTATVSTGATATAGQTGAAVGGTAGSASTGLGSTSTPAPSQDRDAGEDLDAGSEPAAPSGSFRALTYNVAGLPEGLSSSMPSLYTPLIGPLLKPYDLVFLQETWLTPDPNPFAPLRGYHEILVATTDQPYKTVPAMQPFGNDPSRPTALLGDGLNIFSRIPLEETTRVAWRGCVDTEADCLALKGFSLTPAHPAPELTVHLYDLHMEAGDSPEDDQARDAGIDQLIAFMAERSRDTAVIVAGDFNLHTDAEPAKSQLARLLQTAGLRDSCAELACPSPGTIDKVLYRSSQQLQLMAESWRRDTDTFVTADGQPLSDHAPVEVRFQWRAAAQR